MRWDSGDAYTAFDIPDRYSNDEITTSQLAGSGKPWATLPESGANNYVLPSGVPTAMSITGTTLRFTTGGGNVDLTTQDTTYANLAALDSAANTKLAGIATNANNYSLPSDVLKGTISVSGTTVTIPKADGSTYTVSTQDTNTTYSAGDFNIVNLAGYSAAAYANSSVTSFSVDKGQSIEWTNISGQLSPSATTNDWTITWKNGAGTTLGQTRIRAATSGSTSLAAMTDRTSTDSLTAPSGVSVSLGGSTSSGNLQTTTVTLNSISCVLAARILDGSGWGFK